MPEVRNAEDGSLHLEAPSFQADIDRERKVVRVRGANERFGVETAIKYLLAARLAAEGGLLVHGVALADDERAALFTGPSGAGKSTLAALGQQAGFEVLADELVAVWPAPPGYRVFGTPWNVGRPDSAILVGVATLHHAEAPRLSRQPATNVLRVLSENVLLPDVTPEGKQAAFRAQAGLVSGTQSWQFEFSRTGDIGEILRYWLRK
jgi:hypothetical protein